MFMSPIRSVSLTILSATVLFAATHAWAAEINGIAEVRSANEMAVNGTVVRLFGVHAPANDERCEFTDRKYRCGIIAWAELIKLADGQDVSCDVESGTEDGHPLATCYLGERDINEALVRSGWAEARVDIGRYQVDQNEARRARRGLWAERIIPPDRRQAR
jgi:endonuclease YncB( thermonuclease family)